MKYKKFIKIAVFGLIAALLFCFCSCGDEKTDASDSSVKTPQGYYQTAFLGDSLTDKGVYKELITTHYTDYLYENCSFIKNVQNVGYAGSCIAGLPDKAGKMSPSFIERYKQIKNDTDLIIVFGGTNDYGIGSSTLPNPLGSESDTTEETFYGALKILIEGIKTDYPAAKIVFVTPVFRAEQEVNGIPNNNKYGFTLEDYVSAIIDVCNKNSVSVIDAFHELDEINAYTYNEYEVDGLHLNNEGNVLLGKFLKAKLSEILD